MHLEACTILRAQDSLKRALRLSMSCPPEDALYELVRTVVWSLSHANKAPHVSRVINTALPSWRIITDLPESADDEHRQTLRDALDRLEDAGDLAQAAGGRWSPTLPRLVVTDGGPGRLLVGGLPLSMLPINDNAVLHNGPYRHVLQPMSFSALLPEESLHSWARFPEVSLLEWFNELLETVELVRYVPENQDRFEFYLPASAKKHAPQFKRWSESAGTISGLLLARRTRTYGAKEYRLVEVDRGKLVRAGELPPGVVRRLMYGFDAQAKNSVQVRYSPSRSNQMQYVLRSEVPRAEQRILAAFGTLHIPGDRRWERHWYFREGREHALSRFEWLGIEVLPSDRGTP